MKLSVLSFFTSTNFALIASLFANATADRGNLTQTARERSQIAYVTSPQVVHLQIRPATTATRDEATTSIDADFFITNLPPDALTKWDLYHLCASFMYRTTLRSGLGNLSYLFSIDESPSAFLQEYSGEKHLPKQQRPVRQYGEEEGRQKIWQTAQNVAERRRGLASRSSLLSIKSPIDCNPFFYLKRFTADERNELWELHFDTQHFSSLIDDCALSRESSDAENAEDSEKTHLSEMWTKFLKDAPIKVYFEHADADRGLVWNGDREVRVSATFEEEVCEACACPIVTPKPGDRPTKKPGKKPSEHRETGGTSAASAGFVAGAVATGAWHALGGNGTGSDAGELGEEFTREGADGQGDNEMEDLRDVLSLSGSESQIASFAEAFRLLSL